MMRIFAVLFPLVLLATQEPAAQPPSQTGPTTVIRAVTQEVLLDLVVRDKRGRLVRDLKPEEIEVYDDGVPVKLTGFRLVTGQDAAGLGSRAAGAGQPPAPDPLRQLRLVSLVYEGLDNEARRLARQASLDFLKDGLEQNVFVAVFVIGERLSVLQPFTNNLDLLRKAVERATTQHYPQFVAESELIRRQLEIAAAQGAAAQQAAAVNLPGRGNSDTGGIAGASVDAAMAQLTVNMLNFEEILTRTQQSRSSLWSLLSLVREQAALPGRKTVIYFTRGLQVPENMVDVLNSTIAAANRAGVSVYGVDARGLTLDTQNATSISMLQSAAAASRRQQEVIEAAVTPEQVKVFDTALSSIHANTQQALGNLSLSTGGFLVANTNDLRQPLRRIHEDVLTYYEASYVPPITEYDGRFHRITVKVNRPDIRVQARTGYFALPPGQDSVFAWEIPLLRALSLTPLPRDLACRVAALRFGSSHGHNRYAIAVEVPLRQLHARREGDKYATRLSVLAMVKDAHGRVVQRFSRDFPFEVPSDRLDEFQKQYFLETYPAELPPGRYTLEAAVADREGNKAAARRIAVMAPPPATGVRISSLTLVRRLDPLAPGMKESGPLDVGTTRIVPALDHTIQLAPNAGFSFYFVVYPEVGSAEQPRLVLELSRDGSPVAAVSPDLPPPNERGEIPYVASLPMSGFEAGQYELRAIVTQGAAAVEERTVFTINP